MKLAIFLIVGGIGLLCITGYLAYVDFAKSVFSFFRSPQHYRISQGGIPRKELRFIRRNISFDNSTEDERLAKKTLKIFNGVRAIVASGRVDTMLTFLQMLGSIFKKIEVPMGPAANMMRLEWNGTMEKIVKNKFANMSLLGNFNITNYQKIDDEHYAFFWIGDLVEAMDMVLKYFNIQKTSIKGVVEQIRARSDIAEYIIALLYLACSYPKSEDLGNSTLGPVSALVAERYQIGCSKAPAKAFSVCIVRPVETTKIYIRGVTCSRCPEYSTCEHRVQPDGSIMMGDMCVFNPNYTKPEVNVTTTMNPDGNSTTNFLNLYMCIFLISFVVLVNHIRS